MSEETPATAEPSAATAEQPPDSVDPRALVRSKLAQAIGPSAGAMTDAEEISTAIEEEMHRHFKSLKEYNAKARSLLFNLKQSSELRRNVIGRQFTPLYLATCPPKELAPTQLQMQRRESAERYLAQRSLGESQVQVVGWSAGTTGKLEWSHKLADMGGSVPPLAGGVEEPEPTSGDEAGTEQEEEEEEEEGEGEEEGHGVQAAEEKTSEEAVEEVGDASMDESMSGSLTVHMQDDSEGDAGGAEYSPTEPHSGKRELDDGIRGSELDAMEHSPSASSSSLRKHDEEASAAPEEETAHVAKKAFSGKMTLKELLEAPLISPLPLLDCMHTREGGESSIDEVARTAEVEEALRRVREIRARV